MKIDTSKLPKDARLFIISCNVEMCTENAIFNDLVSEHDDTTVYESNVIVRSRKFGMTPYEYNGSTSQYILGDVLKPIGYRELGLPNACPDLPYDEEAKNLWEKNDENI